MNVLKFGVWQVLQDVQDPELKCLAATVPMIVLSSRAKSSTKQYLSDFKRWKSWTVEHGVAGFPAKEHHLALYLQHLTQSLESKAAAEEAVNALG